MNIAVPKRTKTGAVLVIASAAFIAEVEEPPAREPGCDLG
jgi:hypothetical protein